MSKKEAILYRSTEVFLKFGFNKISMDELADQICISKKTIYNNFGSKENLLEEIIFSKMNHLIDSLTEILTRDDLDIMQKMSRAITLISREYGSFDNAIKLDANAARIITSPECVVLNDKIQEAVEDIAGEAKKQGLLKQNINVEMIPYIFLNIIKGMTAWNQSDSVSFSKLELMKHTIEISLDGILTPKGLKELHKS